MFSSANEYTDIVELLIEKKAQLNTQTKVPTPRHIFRGHQFNIMFFPSGGLDSLVSVKLGWVYQNSRDLSASWS